MMFRSKFSEIGLSPSKVFLSRDNELSQTTGQRSLAVLDWDRRGQFLLNLVLCVHTFEKIDCLQSYKHAVLSQSWAPLISDKLGKYLMAALADHFRLSFNAVWYSIGVDWIQIKV